PLRAARPPRERAGVLAHRAPAGRQGRLRVPDLRSLRRNSRARRGGVMPRYASATSVAVERSRAEIERILQRYGASRFAYAAEPERAQVVFEAHGRRVRFVVPLPPRDDPVFTHTEARRSPRRPEEVYRLWEQACRQRWRALALAIKAKLEVVEAGISTFEDEFLAHVILPTGETVGEWLGRQIAHAYQTGREPPLLLGGSPPRRGGGRRWRMAAAWEPCRLRVEAETVLPSGARVTLCWRHLELGYVPFLAAGQFALDPAAPDWRTTARHWDERRHCAAVMPPLAD